MHEHVSRSQIENASVSVSEALGIAWNDTVPMVRFAVSAGVRLPGNCSATDLESNELLQYRETTDQLGEIPVYGLGYGLGTGEDDRISTVRFFRCIQRGGPFGLAGLPGYGSERPAEHLSGSGTDTVYAFRGCNDFQQQRFVEEI